MNLKAYDKTYYKWLLNLPPQLVEQLGWTEGEELLGEARSGVLRIRRATLSSSAAEGESKKGRRRNRPS